MTLPALVFKKYIKRIFLTSEILIKLSDFQKTVYIIVLDIAKEDNHKYKYCRDTNVFNSIERDFSGISFKNKNSRLQHENLES